MIEVERLTKHFGPVAAVDGLSMAVGRGEIVGLLGPNGAGKTTTMRMLTTYIPPDRGRATLAGHDVLDEPIEVRRRVGYLPENVPLYLEMRTREYLNYRARLRDVPRAKRRAAIDRVVASCRLVEVEHRILGQLSKGFRQRVGLAEAMVHDPDILILDEPTAGLDPIQIREVRALIRDLGARHTILLSTHIMSEVEAVCSRVVIIARGRVAVDEPIDRLRTAGAVVAVEARGPADAIRKALESIPGVGRIEVTSRDGERVALEVESRPGADLREAIADRVVRGGWTLSRLDLRRSSLEDRFVQAVVAADLQASQAAGAA